jgi:hypothetical protein
MNPPGLSWRAKEMEHLSEEQLILYRYGEAEDRKKIERHLDTCERCRAEREALELVLRAADSMALPERAESYGAEVWQRLKPGLGPAAEPARREGNAPGKGWAAILSHRRWIPVAAVAALMLAAFIAGRYWPRHEPPAVREAASAQTRDRILLVAVDDHLDRSQMVLVELMNAPEPRKGEVDISFERERAQQLVTANRLYRQTAERRGEAGVASILDDLERVLLEVAHGPDKVSSVELRDLRRRIEAKEIIFKVRVIDGQVRARERSEALRPRSSSAM